MILKKLTTLMLFAFLSVLTLTAFAKREDRLLNVLVALPAFWQQDREEPIEERVERLSPFAQAIHIAAQDVKLRGVKPERMEAALITIAYKETALARNVNSGKCEDMPEGQQCDMHQGKPRARTYFQLWKVACPELHDEALEPGSKEELVIASKCAATRFVSSYYRCAGKNPDGDWAGAFSGYRSIECNWKPKQEYQSPKARYDYMLSVEAKISKAPAGRIEYASK